MAALADRPAWGTTWAAILIAWAICGGWLLSTEVGQQALVDERVRVIESFGNRVSDAQYAALLANPPWWVYFTSGGRLLLTPAVTLLTAAAIWALARRDGVHAGFAHALSIAVHASVVLAVGQLVATPLHALRESLTSPLNLAAVLPLMQEGTVATRFFGTLDVFALWWAGLLAVGLSALTRRPTRRYLLPIVLVYVGFAAVMAVTLTAIGGR